MLKSPFVLALKDPNTDHTVHKARLVVQAMPHVDKDRPHMFPYSPTVINRGFVCY